ncbi:uncharacterized protein Z518_09232 [Rhinocladiella mackenziei CBS 650.93]|uniref:Ubiquitin-conjugating enzyme E2C-binding protein n=1 Tax=Rhinocladiella mackenziei CBS 650.93 TaxID=1442369 RepID=A0A0D2IE58_9EURO|nr:uncharacterized protein Z518_09232 [Rhinocladiella mackenziei CBS 650.93]KIX01506.1 hypothetical protein Z518_09232 [Rhinocladiella mackenziei CBS 650.93]
MPKPKINLYAEALTHIRQLTLHASLQTDKNEHTKILLSSDKKIITALHDGESSSIYLPTQISGTANVTFPLQKTTEISTRLQIDDVDLLKSSTDNPGGVEVPWSAGDLTETTANRCKNCDADILVAGKVITWKDLPSDHWAELVDFWFCHKPHEGHVPHDQSKGFSAMSNVIASPGVGLVDTVSFLLHRDDCVGLREIKHPSRKETTILQCATCKATLGSCQEGETGYRLYKSRLIIIPEPGQSPEKFSTAIFLSAQLLSLIESSVSRKVVVHDGTGTKSETQRQGLLLWIFNPDIYYSSSKRGPTAHRAMKVFYKALSDPGNFLDANSDTYEELLVPEEDFVEFRQTLQESTDILPQAARTFQDWAVGLLDRWERNSTGTARMDENPLNKRVDSGFELFKLPAGMQELYL